MKLAKIVRQAISLARAASDARVAADAADDSPIVSSGRYTSTAKPITLEERRLRAFLDSQPAAVVYMLIAIMYLGRGDYDPKELPERYLEMSETFGSPASAQRQMLVTMDLAGYLDEGYKRVGKTGIDIDKLVAA